MEERVKASIKTKYAEITIESDRKTVSDIILDLQRREEFKERFKEEREKRQESSISEKKGKSPTNATEAIIKLKSEGFFKIKKPLSEVQRELEKNGFIYPNTTLRLLRRRNGASQ